MRLVHLYITIFCSNSYFLLGTALSFCFCSIAILFSCVLGLEKGFIPKRCRINCWIDLSSENWKFLLICIYIYIYIIPKNLNFQSNKFLYITTSYSTFRLRPSSGLKTIGKLWRKIKHLNFLMYLIENRYIWWNKTICKLETCEYV